MGSAGEGGGQGGGPWHPDCGCHWQHPGAAGPTAPWHWESGVTPWTPRQQHRPSMGTSGEWGPGCGEAGGGGGGR